MRECLFMMFSLLYSYAFSEPLAESKIHQRNIFIRLEDCPDHTATKINVELINDIGDLALILCGKFEKLKKFKNCTENQHFFAQKNCNNLFH